MNKLPKVFFVISVVTFAIGSVIWFSAIKVAPEWTVIMPISAVAFGLFLNTLILEKEVAQFGLVNLANLAAYTVYPGMAQIPNDAWLAEPVANPTQ